MNRSDIFNEFVKIAQKKGLISEDAPEKIQKKLEKEHRADSLDISAIESLYGVKPNLPKGMEYTKNIIENAHPDSVIVSNTYDKLNGLVENDQERQNIILHIVNKPTNGHSTQAKYAEKELVLSLVRLGNTLDLKNKDELRSLADTCLMQVTAKQEIKKQAYVYIAAAIAAAIGALYVQQHISFTNEGFKVNHEKLIAEIDDLLESNSNWGVGYNYSSEFKSMLQDFKNKLNQFYDLYSKFLPIIKNLEKPRTAQELMDLAQQSETDSVIKAYETFRSNADNMLPYITTIENNFSSGSYKARQTQDKGWMTSLIDKTQVLHQGTGLISDDFDDVVHAITPYKKSISDILDVLKKAQSLQQSAKEQIQQAAEQSNKEFGEYSDNSKKEDSKDDQFDSGIDVLERDISNGIM